MVFIYLNFPILFFNLLFKIVPYTRLKAGRFFLRNKKSVVTKKKNCIFEVDGCNFTKNNASSAFAVLRFFFTSHFFQLKTNKKEVVGWNSIFFAFLINN